MPHNANRNFMQQMQQNNQRFQQFAQQNLQRQQNQFKNAADGWARDARRRSQQQQQDQVQYQRAAHLQQKARSRQSRPPSAVSSSSWAPTAQPQRLWSQHPLCRRCGSSLYPGLRTCPGCGASAARALGRTLWAAAFIVLLLGLVVLAIAVAVHASARPSQATSQAPIITPSQSRMLPRLAEAVAPSSAGAKFSYRSASKETLS
jgi:ribosomal protein L37E